MHYINTNTNTMPYVDHRHCRWADCAFQTTQSANHSAMVGSLTNKQISLQQCWSKCWCGEYFWEQLRWFVLAAPTFGDNALATVIVFCDQNTTKYDLAFYFLLWSCQNKKQLTVANCKLWFGALKEYPTYWLGPQPLLCFNIVSDKAGQWALVVRCSRVITKG